jgi:hypothetical protein
MDEDRKQYLLTAIWNIREANYLIDGLEVYPRESEIAEILYVGGLMSDDEYDEIIEHFHQNDEYHIKRENGEVDLVKEREEWVENVVGVLCGCSSGIASDAIIEYCNRPDISQRDIHRIAESLNTNL